MEVMWILYILNTEGGIINHGEFFDKKTCLEELKKDEKENESPYIVFTCQRASVFRS